MKNNQDEKPYTLFDLLAELMKDKKKLNDGLVDIKKNLLDFSKRKTNILENQVNENETLNKGSNRFIRDYYNAGNWSNAIAIKGVRIPTKDEIFNMKPEERGKLKEKVLKDLIITNARLINAVNRLKYIMSEAYNDKDIYIEQFLAYCKIYNTLYPDDAILYGYGEEKVTVKEFGGEIITSDPILYASIPGYTRLSVHFGSTDNMNRLLVNANKLICKCRKILKKDNIKYKTVSYKDSETYRNKRDELKKKNEQSISYVEFKEYSSLKDDFDTKVEGIIENNLYPLNNKYDTMPNNTGIINADDNNCERFLSTIRKKNYPQIEALFMTVFASEQFNENEIYYLCERAEVPGPILKKVHDKLIPKISKENSDKDYTEEMKKFLVEQIESMDNKKINPFLKNIYGSFDALCSYDLNNAKEESEVQKQKYSDNLHEMVEFVRCVADIEKEIPEDKRKTVHNLNCEEFKNICEKDYYGVNEYYNYIYDYITSGQGKEDKIKNILTYIQDSEDTTKTFFNVFDDDDLLEMITKLNVIDERTKNSFSKVMSERIKSLYEEDEEAQEDDYSAVNDFLKLENEQDRKNNNDQDENSQELRNNFVSIMRFCDKDAKHIIMENIMKYYKKEGKDLSEIENWIFDVTEDEKEFDENVNIYDEIKKCVGDTNPKSRKEAENLEESLLSKNRNKDDV